MFIHLWFSYGFSHVPMDFQSFFKAKKKKMVFPTQKFAQKIPETPWARQPSHGGLLTTGDLPRTSPFFGCHEAFEAIDGRQHPHEVVRAADAVLEIVDSGIIVKTMV